MSLLFILLFLTYIHIPNAIADTSDLDRMGYKIASEMDDLKPKAQLVLEIKGIDHIQATFPQESKIMNFLEFKAFLKAFDKAKGYAYVDLPQEDKKLMGQLNDILSENGFKKNVFVTTYSGTNALNQVFKDNIKPSFSAELSLTDKIWITDPPIAKHPLSLDELNRFLDKYQGAKLKASISIPMRWFAKGTKQGNQDLIDKMNQIFLSHGFKNVDIQSETAGNGLIKRNV